MASISQALVLNIGTLSEEEIAAMLLAGKAAAEKGIPIVLDPVGAGATAFRTESALRLLRELPDHRPARQPGRDRRPRRLGRGARRRGHRRRRTRARWPSPLATPSASPSPSPARSTSSPAATQTYFVHNGSPLLAAITGSGCMATATIGIFATAGDDPALQTALGLATYGLAAERAAAGAPGPGTFKVRLLDEVAALATSGTSGVDIRTA